MPEDDLDIKSILENFGFKLTDCGPYWQTNAIWRDGNNYTAIQIYKNSGVWRDYTGKENSANSVYFPFRKLVEKVLGTNNKKEINKYLKHENVDVDTFFKKRTDDRIETNVFSYEVLSNLLPHYSFYNKKGIKTAILEFLKSGLSTKGQMYQRYVFPIFDENNLICGLAGRDMTNKSDRPKWKLVGKKNRWAYPLHCQMDSGKKVISEEIEKTSSVILVESIGDMLSLLQNGYKNVLVVFGLDISSKLICSLMEFSLKKITISLNNDLESKRNSGVEASVKNYLKLLGHYDYKQIQICLPLKNDFGDMDEDNFKSWDDKYSSFNPEKQAKQVLMFAKDLFKERKISNLLYKNIKYISHLDA